MLRDCLASTPDRIDARETLANVLLETNRPSAAHDEYEQILAQAPNNVRVRHNFAVDLTHMGENARAIAELRRVLSETSDDLPALNNLGLALLNDVEAAYRAVLTDAK